ncbi:hypothetical protein B0H19DRAFT_58074 [Mycena capillaripes]|nr:hypothetical protein B0H19DRAFT_58074 [Mycena capillaripes]
MQAGCTALQRRRVRLDGLKTQLDRSAPLPISVSLALDNRTRDAQLARAAWSRAADVVRAMVASASRWKELKVDSPSLLHLADVTPGIFASLECLNLRYFPQPENPTVFPLFLPCPNLRRVIVRPFVGQLQMPWAQLTNLELHDRSATTCRAILLQCTSLVSAKVVTTEWVTAEWVIAPIGAPHTVLPCLTSLTLTFVILDNAAWRLDPFLVPFTLPALHTLALGFEPDSPGRGGVWPEQELSAFQDRAPNLAQMSLLFCALESDDLIALLSHAPALTELKLVQCDNCVDDAFLQRFRYDPAQAQAQPLAPRLRELEWRGIGDHFTVDVMEDAFRSRWWTDETERQQLSGTNPNPPGVVRLEKVILAELTDVLLEAVEDRMWDLKDEGLDLILGGDIGAE